MPTRSTDETSSGGRGRSGSAAWIRPGRWSADPVGLLCALSVLVAALLLAVTERGAHSFVRPAAAPSSVTAPAPATALAPATAQHAATAPLVADATPSESDLLGRAAFAAVDWDVTGLGYVIEFAGPRSDVRALTFPYERRIEIYVRPSDTVDELAHVVAHEIGHAIDVEHNDADERREWLVSRGLDADYPWWPGSGLNDFATGAGDFAECFATWRTGGASHSDVPGACDVALLERLVSDER